MFAPLDDRVLVRQATAEEVSKGGIFIPGVAQERPMRGVVVAVGPGALVNGTLVPMSVKVGDKVCFSKFGGVKIPLSDYHAEGHEEMLILLRLNEILLVDK